MAHVHSHHDGHHHHHTISHENKHRLALVLALTGVFLCVEIIGGILSKSLALIADAGHMLVDSGALAIALIAIKLTERPANPQRTFGYYRAEILAALANAVLLVGIAFYIFYEAFHRLQSPVQINSEMVLWVAIAGLAVNITGMLLLRRGAQHSLNLKAAYFEVFADAIASLGVILSAIIIRFTGWVYIDLLVSIGIGIFIFPRIWKLLTDAVGILLEGTPSDVNIAEVRSSIETLPGIQGVHDLHIWALSSGVNAMSVHVVLQEGHSHDEVLRMVQNHVTTTHNIKHATVQVESLGCAEGETHL